MTQLFDLNARIQQLTWSLIFYEKLDIPQAYRPSYLWFWPPLTLGGSVISAGIIHDLRRVKVPGTGPLWNPCSLKHGGMINDTIKKFDLVFHFSFNQNKLWTIGDHTGLFNTTNPVFCTRQLVRWKPMFFRTELIFTGFVRRTGMFGNLCPMSLKNVCVKFLRNPLINYWKYIWLSAKI